METPEHTPDPPAHRRSAIPWRAVLTQLVTIITGVLIALAAQASWSGRQDRDREQKYLHQLRDDLEVTRDRLNAGIASEDSAIHRMRMMVQFLRSTGELPPVDSVRGWIPSNSGDHFQPVMGTLRALMQTGDIGIIKDDSLRAAIIEYDARLDASRAMVSLISDGYISRTTARRDRLETHIIRSTNRWQDSVPETIIMYSLASMRRDVLLAASYDNARTSDSNLKRRFMELRDAAVALLTKLDSAGAYR
ncbi:MAG: hypothetical protein ABIV28_06520 [Longimicrobiales bacterium]